MDFPWIRNFGAFLSNILLVPVLFFFYHLNKARVTVQVVMLPIVGLLQDQSGTACNLLSLPDAILPEILKFLDRLALCAIAQTNKTFFQLAGTKACLKTSEI